MTAVSLPVRHSTAIGLRAGLAAAASVVAVAHVPPTSEHLHTAPYMGVLFIVFTASCLALGYLTLRRPSMAVYAAAGSLCTAGIVTYAATRLVAFPQLADDVGNWAEPLGLVSITAEAVVALTAVLLMRRSAITHR